MSRTHNGIEEQIRRRLRGFVDAATVGPVCEAILRGQVIRLNPEKKLSVVDFRRGVLFVAGREYVIAEE